MTKATNKILITVLLVSLFFISSPAFSQTSKGFIILKVEPGKFDELVFLVQASLMNCKQLVELAHNSIVVVHLECNDALSYQNAISEKLLPLEYVTHTAIWNDS